MAQLVKAALTGWSPSPPTLTPTGLTKATSESAAAATIKPAIERELPLCHHASKQPLPPLPLLPPSLPPPSLHLRKYWTGDLGPPPGAVLH